ncbi:hypothetical protein AXG93_4012s1440 [Marchantia polymorpha subsp. ruderalis]|uniref:Fe2OG dioxygenase domain-containing protein n=1 Tax=Marchantia polymorpha subsp. ruderalis TaxID=1480154 RepID=A0A176VLD3_MARPO|nr:hypothetical protein AXG93_4012s1440 [Marchantia polymorpha subsp. ruderalis]
MFYQVLLPLLLISGVVVSADLVHDLPGWMGETHNVKALKPLVVEPPKVIALSWRPRAFLYKGFLTDEECDHIIMLARNKLKKSMVADNESGKSVESEIRTSSGMFLSKAQGSFPEFTGVDLESKADAFFGDEVVKRVEDKIAAWTFLPHGMLQYLEWESPWFKLPVECNLGFMDSLPIHNRLEDGEPVLASQERLNLKDPISEFDMLYKLTKIVKEYENGEAIQVLRYEYGQKYEPHYDYFQDKYNQVLGGHRVATVLMYLSDVIKGGETVFPSAETKQFKDDTWSECGKRGIGVKPQKGDALLFYSLHPDGSPDESSLHAGCPVIEGEKWSATKWIHVGSFEKPIRSVTDCEDENDLCGEWAAYGECDKNPTYMVGTASEPGRCRKACKVC